MARIRRFSRFSRKPRFRRKGSRGTWFPVNGESWNAGETSWYDASANWTSAFLDVDKGNGPVQWIIPIVPDSTKFISDLSTSQTLRDYVEGQDWLLKSLVGNIHIFGIKSGNTTAFNPSSWWTHIQVAAGFFVARASDSQTGQQFPDLQTPEYDPLNGNNIQDPWIWRRNWIIDNPANIVQIETGHTSDYSVVSNRDYADTNGPFFQTKSARRIRREERLWFTLSAIGWDGERAFVDGAEFQPSVKANLDVRVFGKMVRAKNASAF